jgi:IS605 OrfB family transposase
MRQTLQIKLAPTPEQFKLLKETMDAFNQACNSVAETAFETKTFNNWGLHHLVYRRIRKEFKLSAQMAVRAISKVADAYKVQKMVKANFNLHGAVVYDQRILTWKGMEAVSILTLRGRQRVPTQIGDYQRARIGGIRGQSDLILRDTVFYLAATTEVPEAQPYEARNFLGVDAGVRNIATDGDGERWAGNELNSLRNRYAEIRRRLQSKGTKSSRRLLRKRSRKECRFASAVNHVVSKRIVQKAKDTLRGVALENLRGIRMRLGETVRGSSQRRTIHSWGFNQLQQFIEYKGRVAGVPVVYVDPRNTSRTCPSCGYTAKGNRIGERFKCGNCGYAGHADHVAAVNIGRAAVNQPHVSRDFLSRLGQPQGQATQLVGW